MHRNTKVATCCYCGTRAALVLDAGRHELTCRGCGAPLHNLKGIPITPEREREARARPGPVRHRAPDDALHRRPQKPLKPRKKRKSVAKRFLSEAFDLLEDIFD